MSSEETWTYLGQESRKGWHVWRDPSGETLYYSKVKATRPGGAYSVSVDRDGDSVRVTPSSLRYLGPSREAEDIGDIQATALMWDQQRAAKRLAANTTRTGEIDAACADILALAGKVNDWHARMALAEWVKAKIMNEPFGRRKA